MMRKPELPAPSTVIALMALFFSLGGAVIAAAPTLTSIADATGANVAGVDTVGYLKTAALPTAPRLPFTIYNTLPPGSSLQLTNPTRATVAVTSITFANPFGEPTDYSARMDLYMLTTASSSTCPAPSFSQRPILTLAAPPGGTVSVPYPAGLVFRPSGTSYWCLRATASLKGNPTTSPLPSTQIVGFTASGVFAP